jgi:hypothetical protein
VADLKAGGLPLGVPARRVAALMACILAMTERAAAVALVLHRTARSRAASASARTCLAHAREPATAVRAPDRVGHRHRLIHIKAAWATDQLLLHSAPD